MISSMGPLTKQLVYITLINCKYFSRYGKEASHRCELKLSSQKSKRFVAAFKNKTLHHSSDFYDALPLAQLCNPSRILNSMAITET